MHNKCTGSPWLPAFRKTLGELQRMLQPRSVKLRLLKPFSHHTWLLLPRVGAVSVSAAPKSALPFAGCCIPGVQTRSLPAREQTFTSFTEQTIRNGEYPLTAGTCHSRSFPLRLFPLPLRASAAADSVQKELKRSL